MPCLGRCLAFTDICFTDIAIASSLQRLVVGKGVSSFWAPLAKEQTTNNWTNMNSCGFHVDVYYSKNSPERSTTGLASTRTGNYWNSSDPETWNLEPLYCRSDWLWSMAQQQHHYMPRKFSGPKCIVAGEHPCHSIPTQNLASQDRHRTVTANPCLTQMRLHPLFGML